MNAEAYSVQKVSVLFPNARWRRGTGKQSPAALAAATCCRCKAGPAQADGRLSVAEEMLSNVWIPVRGAVVPGRATTFCAWSLFFKKLHTVPEQLTLQGFLSQPPAAFLPKT